MIVIPLAAFLFAYYFVNVAGIPQAFKKGFSMMPHQRIKPFDCVTCLSVWSAVALYFLPIEISQFTAIIFGAGFLGIKMK
ncbi:hypothetical protein EBU24_06470 [bacterium]|jgi:hypothetical protein|nr:hypothetical protein [bacterium]